MKHLKKLLLSFFLLSSLAHADVPRGYKSTQEFDVAKEDAISKKKLLTILFKGSDDNCPNCDTTIENGEKAAKSSSVLLFARVNDFHKNKTGLPKEILKQVDNLSGGASVSFYVFNPTTLELVTKGSRTELQNNKKKIKEFKDAVRAAKKELKNS